MFSHHLTRRSAIKYGHQSLLREARLYAGFSTISRALLKFWKDTITEIGDRPTTMAAIASTNKLLLSDNVVIFFDHHYAFDALPATMVLGKHLKYISGAIVPYAVHLDMGVDPTGRPSFQYRLRTAAFQWLAKNIQEYNSNVHILPVAREFELQNPRLKAILDRRFRGVNTRYLKRLALLFSQYQQGLACILSPTAGLALPEKPLLHPQVYRSLDLLQSRRDRSLPYFFVGAYPRLYAHRHYLAPLLARHTFVAQGPFTVPLDSYDSALEVVSDCIHQIRQAANFVPPDYSRIKHK